MINDVALSSSDFSSLLLCRAGSELSTSDLQKMVQALPQYNEQMEKLSLHVEVVPSFSFNIYSFISLFTEHFKYLRTSELEIINQF